MHSRAQLALFRPGPEVTALRELFSEFLSDPDIVRRLSDLLSGADNHYTMDAPEAEAHPLVGRWVPDFAAALTDIRDHLTVAVGRPVGEIAATAVLVRPDGYVAWASSQARPDPDELRELRRVLKHWFGI
jgi:hypothetical protein